jgi:hypothetical protein
MTLNFTLVMVFAFFFVCFNSVSVSFFLPSNGISGNGNGTGGDGDGVLSAQGCPGFLNGKQ